MWYEVEGIYHLLLCIPVKLGSFHAILLDCCADVCVVLRVSALLLAFLEISFDTKWETF